MRPGSSFENESPSARLFIRVRPSSSARLRPPLPAHGGVTSQPDAADVPSSSPGCTASSPFRRRPAATPEEALYLTANNRTIFHVTAFARLATSTRPRARLLPAFARRSKRESRMPRGYRGTRRESQMPWGAHDRLEKPSVPVARY